VLSLKAPAQEAFGGLMCGGLLFQVVAWRNDHDPRERCQLSCSRRPGCT
jgi:hypothetical protein